LPCTFDILQIPLHWVINWSFLDYPSYGILKKMQNTNEQSQRKMINGVFLQVDALSVFIDP